MNQKCEVSVLCTTYNQAKYLRKALDSILEQKTSFGYEVIIHDDASTDGTVEIIKEFVKRYPKKIICILEEENQYSKGVRFIAQIIKNKAKGKYIAICEGDDFWVDVNKLEMQYSVMEKHQECDLCACWGYATAEDGKTEISQIRPRVGDGILTAEETILGGGQFLVSAGLFFRKSLYDWEMNFAKDSSLDYVVQIKGALRGGIYYIDKRMAAYRRYADGSWTNRVLHNSEKLKKQWNFEIKMLETLDIDTAGKYHDTIVNRMKAYVPFEQQMESEFDAIDKVINMCHGRRFIWGMGRRGKSLEHFLYEHGIKIDGVCDAVDSDIDRVTEYGNRIFSTEDVLAGADIIFSSTRQIYDDLKKSGFRGEVIDFQKFMPNG